MKVEETTKSMEVKNIQLSQSGTLWCAFINVCELYITFSCLYFSVHADLKTIIAFSDFSEKELQPELFFNWLLIWMERNGFEWQCERPSVLRSGLFSSHPSTFAEIHPEAGLLAMILWVTI